MSAETIPGRHNAFQIAKALGRLNRLPKRVDETESPNSISRKNGIRIALSNGGRPYVCRFDNGSKDIIGKFVPVLVNFIALTVVVVQGEKGKPFITFDNIITPEGKVENTADALILFNTHEEQRLYDPQHDNSQDMASTVDPTDGFVYTGISGERYGGSCFQPSSFMGLFLASA